MSLDLEESENGRPYLWNNTKDVQVKDDENVDVGKTSLLSRRAFVRSIMPKRTLSSTHPRSAFISIKQ